MALKPFLVRRDTAVAINKGIMMKKISFALVGAASLALAACGGKGDDALNNVEENVENVGENLDALANDTAAETDTLGNQVNALEAESATNADASGATDGNAANAVNAM